MSAADELRAAADRLESPTLCNTNPWDAPVTAWLRRVADAWETTEDETGLLDSPEDLPEVEDALAVARAIPGGSRA